MEQSAPRHFPGIYPGTISVPPDVAELVSSADAVLLGSVIAVREEEPLTYRIGNLDVAFVRKMAVLGVERCLKGTVYESRVEIEFLEPQVPSSLTVLSKAERAVLFLKRKRSHFQLVDLVTSKIDMADLASSLDAEIRSQPDNVRQVLEAATLTKDQEVASIAKAILQAI